MFKSLLLALVAATALSTALYADDMTRGISGQVRSEVGKAMGSEEMMKDAASTNTDRAFTAVMISHARLQRQLSDLVAEKATNAEIKKYAKEMSEEAEQFAQKIGQAAEKAGITLQQDKLLPSDQAMLEFAKQLPASALQRHYIFHQAGATQTHLLMAQWAAKNAQKPEIQQMASNMASKLETRHETAQKLAQSEVSSTGRMATE